MALAALYFQGLHFITFKERSHFSRKGTAQDSFEKRLFGFSSPLNESHLQKHENPEASILKKCFHSLINDKRRFRYEHGVWSWNGAERGMSEWGSCPEVDELVRA
jgi:hypothetical protein